MNCYFIKSQKVQRETEGPTYSLLAYVNKAKFWVDSWHPYLFISKNFTDQEKNGCQFFH